jgi:hypothetical protein
VVIKKPILAGSACTLLCARHFGLIISACESDECALDSGKKNQHPKKREEALLSSPTMDFFTVLCPTPILSPPPFAILASFYRVVPQAKCKRQYQLVAERAGRYNEPKMSSTKQGAGTSCKNRLFDDHCSAGAGLWGTAIDGSAIV